MKRYISIIALLLTFSIAIANNGNDEKNSNETNTGSPAQTMSLSGQVVDFETGEVLTGVEVSIEGTDMKVFTDFDGKFEFKDVSKGDYSIVASFISYKNSLIENLKSEEEINIKLQSKN